MKKEPNLSRRILIYAVMAFCMAMLTYLAWYGRDNSDLHKLLADGCFYTMAMVVLIYVLGANVDQLIAALPFVRGTQQPPQHPPEPRRDYRRPRPHHDPDDGID